MAPAPKSALAPETTPSPSSDSSPPPPDSSPPLPPSSPSPPPPKPSKTPPTPPPPKSQPSADDDDSKGAGDSPPAPSPPNVSPPPAPSGGNTGVTPPAPPPPTIPTPGFLPPAATSPPPPAAIPSRDAPPSPNILPNPGNGSDKSAPDPARKIPSPSNRKSASKSSPDSDSDYSATNIPIIIGGIAAAVAVFLAIVVICLLCKKKKKKGYYIHEQGPEVGGPYYYGKPDHVVKVGNGGGGWGQSPQPPPMNASNEFPGPRVSVASVKMPMAFSRYQFSYDELVIATRGFTQYNILGQGGFGYVHKGVLPNGQDIAVKSLKTGSGQGEREFQAEVEIISRVHHRHLVSLVGYCISDGQRMLVYEYVPNNTLEFHLHGKGQVVMDWQTRMRIAVGSAKGLAYLHEDCHPRIIHRDIKSANILLDHDYEAKVADFGLAKLTTGNDTHVSTRVMGTFGYLAPEYASSGKLSEKSDTFSFGVMLLEILTGRKPIDPETEYMNDSLVEWARPLIAKATEDGDYNELVDPHLKSNYNHTEMEQMASCAAAGVRHSARRRPKMSQIVRALEGIASLDSLDEKETTGLDTNESRVYDTQAYNDDMLKFRKMVMSTEESSGSEIGSSGQYR
ncbi:proline-rich receptor-like protein kinase PERK15 [Bidens hawaiensis]|uniref:proline-rich receptor-like protein kinase PERK15 n=1 Tax=Bidens hawaiensis TaxID=980011 RepID=UPI00404ACA7A